VADAYTVRFPALCGILIRFMSNESFLLSESFLGAFVAFLWEIVLLWGYWGYFVAVGSVGVCGFIEFLGIFCFSFGL